MAITAKIIGMELIEKALMDGFEQWAKEDINEAHWDDQFKEDKWKWDQATERENGEVVFSPRKTKRKNGEVVFSPRDIYDLGNLYKAGVDSLDIQRSSNGIIAEWDWSEARNSSGDSYAWYVHEGTSRHPGRPFTDDISIPSSFFRKAPGKALKLRIGQHLERLNAS